MKQGEVMGTEKQKIIFKPEKNTQGGVMTKKFERVLSDAELFELAALSNPLLHADSDGDFYLNETGQNIDFDSVMALLRKVEKATIEALNKQPAEQGSVDHHIADMRKMVADMYWISDEFSTETILDAFDPIVSMIDVSVGDTFEVKRAKTLPSITVEVTEMTEYGDVEAYKIVDAEHIPNDGKMFVPDGWQVVPKEPDWDMEMAGVKKLIQCTDGELECIDGNLLDSYRSEVNEIFCAMLAAAPKFGEEG